MKSAQKHFCSNARISVENPPHETDFFEYLLVNEYIWRSKICKYDDCSIRVCILISCIMYIFINT